MGALHGGLPRGGSTVGARRSRLGNGLQHVAVEGHAGEAGCADPRPYWEAGLPKRWQQGAVLLPHLDLRLAAHVLNRPVLTSLRAALLCLALGPGCWCLSHPACVPARCICYDVHHEFLDFIKHLPSHVYRLLAPTCCKMHSGAPR